MVTGSFRQLTKGLLILPLVTVVAPAQVKQPVRIEPGLEDAVSWKWWVEPSEENDWGLRLADERAPEEAVGTGAETGTGSVATAAPVVRPTSYEVVRGDALSKIARKFGMTVAQLKTANELKSDLIKIGQVLKIPTREELRAMAPPEPEPVPEAVENPENGTGDSTGGGTEEGAEPPKPRINEVPVEVRFSRQTRTVFVQAYLDRKGFSSGPIDGFPGGMLEAAEELYRSVNTEIMPSDSMVEIALDDMGDAYTYYTLKAEDFRFIAPSVPGEDEGTRGGKKSDDEEEAVEPPPVTFDELTDQDFMAYTSPWEFVAERFHCAERFLRKVNTKIKGEPKVGTEFKVPNVEPFEIEKAFAGELQPASDPAKPVRASVVNLERLEVYEGEKLVAAFPLSRARPDLRGRGRWTILDVIPRPRLVTKGERKGQANLQLTPVQEEPVAPLPDGIPRATPVVRTEQDLAAGPNNPLGLVWINLAKSGSSEALPYGLHGTSIPGRMKTQESLGGFRLSNWDIMRAVRMLPRGTVLEWR